MPSLAPNDPRQHHADRRDLRILAAWFAGDLSGDIAERLGMRSAAVRVRIQRILADEVKADPQNAAELTRLYRRNAR